MRNILGKRSALVLALVVVVLAAVSATVVWGPPRLINRIQTENVVVTTQAIASGAVLMASFPFGVSPSAFTVKSEPISQVPHGAYRFTTESALICHLNLLVVIEVIPRGYILRQNDPHIVRQPKYVGGLSPPQFESPYSCPA